MTVGELRKALEGLPEDMLVIMEQSDWATGNCLASVENAKVHECGEVLSFGDPHIPAGVRFVIGI